MNTYISIQYIFANGQNSKYIYLCNNSLKQKLGNNIADVQVDKKKRNSQLNKSINKVSIDNDSVAGIVTTYLDFYGVWYFHKENGKWASAGENIGGATLLEAEISFREKASMHLDNLNKYVGD